MSNTNEKIKAIFPHIVVGGDIDKPYYTIHWYDIEQKTMICGFGSYKLELVRKWLEEEFEVVERDIDNLIKSQEAEIEKLQVRLRKERHQFDDLGKMYSEIRAEAIKEFAERLKETISNSLYQYWNEGSGGYYLAEDVPDDIDNLVKEMVGEGK